MDRVNLDSVSGSENENGAESENAAEEEAGEESGPKVVDRRRVQLDEDGQADVASDLAEQELAARKPTYVEELEKKVTTAEEKLREHIDRLDKESADFRARQNRELERRTLQARKETVSMFLGIADDLGRATFAASESLSDRTKSEEAFESLVQGVRLIQGRFFQELASLGVKPFAAKGEKFDPERHEAVRTIDVDDPAQDGVVVEELAQGYILSEEVLRPSTVAVGKFSRAT